MAIKKASGGVEDLALGMGTRVQLRKGSEETITELNGSHIPYSETQSTNQKIDEVDSKIEAPTNGLNNHVANKSNPHEVTAEQAGAEPDLGNPAQDGYILSSTLSGARSWVPVAVGGGGTVAWGQIIGTLSQQTDLQDELNLKLNKADPTFTGVMSGPEVDTTSVSIYDWTIKAPTTGLPFSIVRAGGAAFVIESDALDINAKNDGLYIDNNQVMVSDITQDTGAKVIENMVEITQADYDAITPVANTVYFIVG